MTMHYKGIVWRLDDLGHRLRGGPPVSRWVCDRLDWDLLDRPKSWPEFRARCQAARTLPGDDEL